MVKPPKIRHSKVRKQPVTIDLDPADVKREADAAAEAAAKDASAFAEAEQPVKPNAVDEALADAEAAPEPVTPADEPALDEPAGGEEVRYGPFAAESSPVERRRGMPALAAGVAGAVIALAGAAALQWAGALPAPRSENAAVDSASLDVLRAEIEALKQQAAAEDTADPALAQSPSESSGRIDTLMATIEQLQADFAVLQSQAAPPADASALQALETRLAELEAAAGANGKNDAALASATEQLAAMQESVRAAVEGTTTQAGRLDAIEQRIAEMNDRVEAQAAEPGMALAVAATSLKSAIDRGTPFMMELETYAAIAPDMPQIAALRDMAASGVPTRAQIEMETADAAGRMIAASAAPADSNAGFLERMFTSAQSLIEVRPVGTIEGDSPGAIVARMEVALKQGDYEKAITDFQTLPPPVQAAGQEFIDKVEARHAADRLVAEALAGAVKTPGNEG